MTCFFLVERHPVLRASVNSRATPLPQSRPSRRQGLDTQFPPKFKRYNFVTNVVLCGFDYY